MNLPAQLFPENLLWLANFLFAFVLGRAVWYAPWKKLLGNSTRVNAMVAVTLGTFFIWQMQAGIRPGLNHHLLGATLFVLLFGWEIAIFLMTLVLSATLWRAGLDFFALGLNGLLTIVLPVWFTQTVLRLSQQHLPKTFFLFVLGNGFLCGVLTMLLTVLSIAVTLAFFTHYSWDYLQHRYLAFTPAMIFGEGFVTGALMTAFTLFQPEAVYNFDEDSYMSGK